MIDEQDRYVCTIYTTTIQQEERDTGWRCKSWETACHVLLQFLKEWDKGYQGSSRESGEDISGYWGRKILTLYTLLWMPNPCKLFHAKQWWLREVSALFLHFSFHYSVQWAINLLVINKSTQNHYKFEPSCDSCPFPRCFLSNNIT